ncbi:MAG: hypothetical protein EOQ42_33700 [Mesorhizobium sp.]|nr:MAG: hypothetical protein EOQ42_33700 [Mesorhizobium sp.]
MHVVLPLWLVPLTLSVLIWAGAVFWPSSRGSDAYPIAVFWALVRFSAAAAATLLTWLAYFIWLVVAGA